MAYSVHINKQFILNDKYCLPGHDKGTSVACTNFTSLHNDLEGR